MDAALCLHNTYRRVRIYVRFLYTHIDTSVCICINMCIYSICAFSVHVHRHYCLHMYQRVCIYVHFLYMYMDATLYLHNMYERLRVYVRFLCVSWRSACLLARIDVCIYVYIDTSVCVRNIYNYI